jgi:isopentenyl diphosphate isomerase/L-lactate dehydrogenase-like FMN-dependent dehydrogenase
MTDEPTGARARQTDIFMAGVAGRRPAVPVAPPALERAAERALSRRAAAYLIGGAGAETTMAANRAAFDRWRIVPRVLTDTSVRDLGVTLFGRRLPTPLLLAPVGVLELAHRDADVAVARAAAAAGVPMIQSSQASRPMEEVATVMGAAPRWFQLYWSQSTELALSFVERAEASGCDAIVLTLDTTSLGWRPRDLTWRTCRSCGAWGSRSTPATRCSAARWPRTSRPTDGRRPG